MADLENHSENQKQPLLNINALAQNQKNQAHKAINQTFQSTAHLANLLPTGTVLAFQLLSPILANQGKCTSANRFMTACLLVMCIFSCFILSFSDSFRDSAGNVQHGIATFTGFWVVDGPDPLPAETARKYRIRFVDFIHALMSVMVFIAVVLVDQNVVVCFYPSPSEDVKQIVTALPVAIGAICSVMFIAFPTTRHGIGFPLSAQ
ncbi:uncharacterized protein LOC110018469 [Phalaenopsis equestris]|uniref:uncharacterized protein LOC110018469 n=1 Tax=Phalaenopsis equestris TaxID=78828 RepID=UPI0009E4530B|nr:uncharacterized protein LOC110018469 [Phalaenopsis equestris]